MTKLRKPSSAGITRASLPPLGFLPKEYPGQDGVFLTWTGTVERLAYARDTLCDHDSITLDMALTVELCPNNSVQLYVHDADYLDGPWDLLSEDGQRVLAYVAQLAS